MDQNKFYKILYKRIIKGNVQEFTYRGIYLGRDGMLISFNEAKEGQMFLNESNINLISEITAEEEQNDILRKIHERGEKNG